LHDPQEAEDLSQEAFLRVWRALPNFRAESSFRTWLYRIVTNLCYDRLPGLKKELAALDPDEMTGLADEYKSPEACILTGELEARLHKMIHDMPDGYRLLITLRHMQDMSYAEIAEVTGMPLGTVKTGIFRGRRLLKVELEAYEKENG
jgi:RNA polymerase sigma-70 factor (ECF subfamily)